MKLHPRNVVLLVLVVVSFVLELVLREEDTPAIDRTPAFERIDPRTAVRLRIEDATDAPAVVLEREGEHWTLGSWHGFPAHDWVVEDLTSRLRGLQRSDLVSSDPSAGSLFGFDGSERTLTIEGEGDRVLARVETSAGPDGRGSHVREKGGADIYRAPALALPEVDPRRFVKADLFEFDPAALKVIEIELPADEVLARLERVDDGRWKNSQGELFAPSKVDGLVTWASHLYLQDVVAAAPQPEHGLEGRGWARLRLELEDGERELVLGALRSAEDGGLGERYATRKGWETPWVVTVSPLTSERLSQLAQTLSR